MSDKTHLYPPGKVNKQDIEFGDNVLIPAGALTLVKRVTRTSGGVQTDSLHFDYKYPIKVIDSGFNDNKEGKQ